LLGALSRNRAPGVGCEPDLPVTLRARGGSQFLPTVLWRARNPWFMVAIALERRSRSSSSKSRRQSALPGCMRGRFRCYASLRVFRWGTGCASPRSGCADHLVGASLSFFSAAGQLGDAVGGGFAVCTRAEWRCGTDGPLPQHAIIQTCEQYSCVEREHLLAISTTPVAITCPHCDPRAAGLATSAANPDRRRRQRSASCEAEASRLSLRAVDGPAAQQAQLLGRTRAHPGHSRPSLTAGSCDRALDRSDVRVSEGPMPSPGSCAIAFRLATGDRSPPPAGMPARHRIDCGSRSATPRSPAGLRRRAPRPGAPPRRVTGSPGCAHARSDAAPAARPARARLAVTRDCLSEGTAA
jgi:hypothetical protein